MTRRIVTFADLPSFLRSRFNREIEPVRKESEEHCSGLQDILNDVGETGRKLLREKVEEEAKEASKSSISSADKFGRKIVDLVEGAKAPCEMSYDSMVRYTNALRNFQSQIVNAASIWIPRLPLSLKKTVRELEVKMKLLGYSVNSLENHVGGKHRQVDRLERIILDSESLAGLEKELNDLETSIHEREDNSRKLDEEEDSINLKVDKLDSTDVSRRLTEQERQLGDLRNRISGVFEPLQKPVEKVLKTTDSKNGLLGSREQEILQHYLGDPTSAVENEDDFGPLRSSLGTLRRILTAGSIELKESRVRNALRSISEICSTKNLEELRAEYRRQEIEYNASQSSNEIVELIMKRRELEQRKEKIGAERSRLTSDLEELEGRRSELLLRISRLVTDLEERVKSAGKEELEIVRTA
jgi:hypothetical protein